MIWVNFKSYKQTFGQGALNLAKICQKISQETKVKIIPVVSSLNLVLIKKEIKSDVWLQHLDLYFEGSKTGYLSPLAAIMAGADGALLNHSEQEIAPGKVRQILAYLRKPTWQEKWLKEVDGLTKEKLNKFQIMVCFKTKGQLEKWVKKLKPRPDFLGYEVPELIGSQTSIAQEKPKAIERIVKESPEYRIVVGAGIHQKDDVQTSLQLGAKGILVSSDVVKAKDPEKELKELALAFKNETKK